MKVENLRSAVKQFVDELHQKTGSDMKDVTLAYMEMFLQNEEVIALVEDVDEGIHLFISFIEFMNRSILSMSRPGDPVSIAVSCGHPDCPQCRGHKDIFIIIGNQRFTARSSGLIEFEKEVVPKGIGSLSSILSSLFSMFKLSGNREEGPEMDIEGLELSDEDLDTLFGLKTNPNSH